ncbi:GyrI-like domain-containing protein [Stackebrandtia soli]|uniref:GyrI-like domain-containing protein n=1 Tax=Stackebrandtia soli TaxID=1892856 RepID=UPI0039EAC5DE
MGSRLTAAELTLLGLIVERPRHGYALEEVITERGMREWTEIGFSSIYYLITKLRERGLIEPTEEARSAEGKARKVYAATDEGRRMCAIAVEQAIAELHPTFPRVLAGLANQPAVDRVHLLRALGQRATALGERIAHIQSAADAQGHAPEFVQAIFDYSLGQLTAEQAWLSRYRTSLEGTHHREGETPMTPYDVKRDLKALYAPKNTKWAIVDIPEQRFIAVDGTGDPNTSQDYTHAVEALYAVAYTLKFASKRADGGRDFVVGPLEGLWWSDRPDVFVSRDKSAWNWTMFISLPSWITDAMIDDGVTTALEKKKLPAISQVRQLTLHEGPSAQVLHIGSYDDETRIMNELHHTYLDANSLRPSGRHHEVYLSDPRKTAPEKLRTVLRQPVEPVNA